MYIHYRDSAFITLCFTQRTVHVLRRLIPCATDSYAATTMLLDMEFCYWHSCGTTWGFLRHLCDHMGTHKTPFWDQSCATTWGFLRLHIGGTAEPTSSTMGLKAHYENVAQQLLTCCHLLSTLLWPTHFLLTLQ
jgi:hypothetical protein